LARAHETESIAWFDGARTISQAQMIGKPAQDRVLIGAAAQSPQTDAPMRHDLIAIFISVIYPYETEM
jgi:hypothetical protein